jgi:hypothetical protein
LVLAVSNITLLPVLFSVAPSKTVLSRFVEAVGHVFESLELDQQKVAGDLASMKERTVATANNRRVLGSMNDFARILDAYLDGRTLVDVALQLAEAPCSPLGMVCPRDATLALFSAPSLRLVRR